MAKMLDLSPAVLALISFILILVTLFSGMWIFLGLGVSGLVCAAAFGGGGSFVAMPYVLFDSTNSFALTALVTFVLMGEILLRSGISSLLFRGAAALMGFLPGALYHAVVVAAGIFAACSGSSVASCATIGKVALPDLNKRGYNRELSLGVVAGGSMLANFIPPSIGLIIYGACTLESVSKLFVASTIPGLIILVTYLLYIGTVCSIRPEYSPAAPVLPLKGRLKDIAQLVPILVIATLVLGSLYSGVATPTEAGTVGVICALVLAAAYRKLTWGLVKECFLGCVRTTSMVMILVVTGYIMGSVYGYLGLPQSILNWVRFTELSPHVVMIGVIIFYTILGCFLETLPVLILSIGTIYPLILAMGYNGIWFGVLSCIVLTAGLLTPPVGMSLYIVQGIPPGASLSQAARGSFPFLIILYVVTAMLIIWPGLALWLPNKLFGS